MRVKRRNNGSKDMRARDGYVTNSLGRFKNLHVAGSGSRSRSRDIFAPTPPTETTEFLEFEFPFEIKFFFVNSKFKLASMAPSDRLIIISW